MTRKSPRRLGLRSILITGGLMVAAVSYAQNQDRRLNDPQSPSQRPTYDRSTASQQTPTAQQFVQEAALSGLKEVRLGQIASEKAQDSEVKQFAQHMIRDHSAANQKLTLIARSKGIPVPSTNTFSAGAGRSDREYVRERDPARPGERSRTDTTPGTPATPGTADRQQSRERQMQGSSPQQDSLTIERLQALSATEFDRAYMAEMVKDHAKAVQKFESASQNLQDAELKQFATETLPKLQEHHQMAQQISTRIASQSQEGGQDKPRQQTIPQN